MFRVSRQRALPRAFVKRYHDDASFGYRVPSKYKLPDCKYDGSAELMTDTDKELSNRNTNAQLLRYVEMVRRHGHRAAKVS